MVIQHTSCQINLSIQSIIVSNGIIADYNVHGISFFTSLHVKIAMDSIRILTSKRRHLTIAVSCVSEILFTCKCNIAAAMSKLKSLGSMHQNCYYFEHWTEIATRDYRYLDNNNLRRENKALPDN